MHVSLATIKREKLFNSSSKSQKTIKNRPNAELKRKAIKNKIKSLFLMNRTPGSGGQKILLHTKYIIKVERSFSRAGGNQIRNFILFLHEGGGELNKTVKLKQPARLLKSRENSQQKSFEIS